MNATNAGGAKRIRLGTSGWKYDDWKGAFYPEAPKGRALDELAFYARRFDTVEIDSTWYRTPARHVVASWRRRVTESGSGAGVSAGGGSADFRFAAKVPRLITHDKALADCAADLNDFLRAIGGLEERLGPLLFQFPPQWSPQEGAAPLRAFLPLLPRDWKFAMEFRHPAWCRNEYFDLLRAAGVAWALADPNRFPSALPATAPFTYIRWLGNRHEPLEPLNTLKKDRSRDEARWAEAITALPVGEVWGYFNNHWAGFSPGSVDLFKQRLGLPVTSGVEKNEQGTLF